MSVSWKICPFSLLHLLGVSILVVCYVKSDFRNVIVSKKYGGRIQYLPVSSRDALFYSFYNLIQLVYVFFRWALEDNDVRQLVLPL